MRYPVDRAGWIGEARLVAEEIERTARRGRGGTLTWEDPDASDGRPLGPHLYGGDAGIALFLAALESMTESSGRYRDLSFGALVRIRHRLAELSSSPSAAGKVNLRLGAMIGIGGFIYSLLRVGGWLGERTL